MIDLTEQETRTRYITPAIQNAGWQPHQIREEVNFTDGRIIVRGQMSMRGQRKKADYILYHGRDLPLAIVEAKKKALSVGNGMQQALEYGAILDIPFVYSSNGEGFVEHDGTGMANAVERHLALDAFPSPATSAWLSEPGLARAGAVRTANLLLHLPKGNNHELSHPRPNRPLNLRNRAGRLPHLGHVATARRLRLRLDRHR